jgi:hypothetical protein
MASMAGFLLAREGDNGSRGAANHLYHEEVAAANGSNSTLALIQSLVFAENKSVRTSTIILAAFNVLASATTAASILYDCYWASKRCNPKFKASWVYQSSVEGYLLIEWPENFAYPQYIQQRPSLWYSR